MPRYYCPKCHDDFPEDIERCPRCGLNISAYYDAKDYVDKLIIALRHPEPETSVRAAWLLGKIKDERAVTPLIGLIGETDDVYIARTAVEALGEIGTDGAVRFLNSITNHPSIIVKKEVERQLGRLKKSGT
jgi:HEAT repeat protein